MDGIKNQGEADIDCDGPCDACPCTAGANGQPCQNGGFVTGTTGTCGCSCATGYEGDNCETASPCTAGANGQPCQYGGTATGTTGTCGCSCPEGYVGANCEIPPA